MIILSDIVITSHPAWLESQNNDLQRIVRNRVKHKESKKPLQLPHKDYKWNELGKLAERFYQDYAAYNFEEQTNMLNSRVEQLLFLIDSKTNKELYKEVFYDKWTLGRLIQLNSASPYKNTRGRIRKWKRAKEK